MIAEVALIERKEETGKHLSVGLPTRTNPERAVRMTIDQNEPVSRPISKCNEFVCSAEYEAGAELVDQLKHGQTLVVEVVDRDETAYTLTVPLAGFAKTYDGPPAPVPEVQEASQDEMKALRAQSERATEERQARCGSR